MPKKPGYLEAAVAAVSRESTEKVWAEVRKRLEEDYAKNLLTSFKEPHGIKEGDLWPKFGTVLQNVMTGERLMVVCPDRGRNWLMTMGLQVSEGSPGDIVGLAVKSLMMWSIVEDKVMPSRPRAGGPMTARATEGAK